ncbi:MAG: reverse transcriptase [Actinobacteria bacterium]|nr:reverse transcriptase [Actinomycetota bacterium]MCG2819981.1 reverse transcriptase [Actinomycetes bacterium]MBU4179122.1 reverse transcriptase [Actinomycetota bacterium]MBU4219630.1 reverse transcriptase [Actinomycetota bacterium]MBU4357744.1 reverse transcriptase [Actinomycetota bacterium]
MAKNRLGEFFVGFLPAVSNKAIKAIRQTIRRWRLHLHSDKSLEDLAQYINRAVSGWINYYGSYSRSALYPVFRHLNRYLVRWVTRKYKRLRGHNRRSCLWLDGVARREPGLFAHWRLLYPLAGR